MAEDDQSGKLAKLAFGASFPSNAASGDAVAADRTIEHLVNSFEDAAQVDDEGREFWFARDLQILFGYAKWDNFLTIIQRAKSACTHSGRDCDDHFADVGKMVPLGSGAVREIDDIVLSRYACYLTAQNGDGRKRPIAFAQTYFAIQARRQEVRDQQETDYTPLSEDERRVLLRDEIKEHNKNLASAAKNAGVRDGPDFAVFQTEGYKGLYGGLDVAGIRRRKGLSARHQILDHMGSTELAANLFRATQTEEKLRREGVQGKTAANRTHYLVGQKVRQTIREIGGDMPETLPPAEDIKKVGRRLARPERGNGDLLEG
jgi:DNA-damage-inducible protein D